MTWKIGYKIGEHEEFTKVTDRFDAYEALYTLIDRFREEDEEVHPMADVDSWWQPVLDSLEALKGLTKKWSATSSGKQSVELWAEQQDD